MKSNSPGGPGVHRVGAFTPVIDSVYPLDQIVKAYEYAKSRQKIGNVVIGVASTS